MKCNLDGVLICTIDGKKRSFKKIPKKEVIGNYEYSYYNTKENETEPVNENKIKTDPQIEHIYVSNGDEKWLVLGGGVHTRKIYDSELYWDTYVGKGNWDAVNSAKVSGPILTNVKDFNSTLCTNNIKGLSCFEDNSYDFIIFDNATIYDAIWTDEHIRIMKNKLKKYGQLMLQIVYRGFHFETSKIELADIRTKASKQNAELQVKRAKRNNAYISEISNVWLNKYVFNNKPDEWTPAIWAKITEPIITYNTELLKTIFGNCENITMPMYGDKFAQFLICTKIN